MKVSLFPIEALFDHVGVLYLCRRVECCSTVTGAQGCSRWWPGPAARSQSGRRNSESPRPGKRPFQCSAYWWRLRRGSGMAHTSQLPGGKKTDAKTKHNELNYISAENGTKKPTTSNVFSEFLLLLNPKCTIISTTKRHFIAEMNVYQAVTVALENAILFRKFYDH